MKVYLGLDVYQELVWIHSLLRVTSNLLSLRNSTLDRLVVLLKNILIVYSIHALVSFNPTKKILFEKEQDLHKYLLS